MLWSSEIRDSAAWWVETYVSDETTASIYIESDCPKTVWSSEIFDPL